jgi:hypothetical protein
MKKRASMFEDDVRAVFESRIRRLQPDSRRRWGRMNAAQMVCHLSDQLRMSLGDISAKTVSTPLRYPVVKHLVIDVLPWPKGRIKGPPEAFTTSPTDWQRDITTLLDLLQRFGKEQSRPHWPPHPMFGTMTGPLWSRLTCRHFNHHLNQFGA